MTQVARHTIPCPECDSRIEVEVYSSVNVTIDPSLREQIFNDSLVVHGCPGCGQSVRVLSDLLYHDMRRRFAVWYRPRGTGSPDEAGMPAGTFAGHYLVTAPVTADWEQFKKTILEQERTCPVVEP